LNAAGGKLVAGPSIVQSLKARKNHTEREGFVNCHIRDGVALTRFLAWLDEKITSGAHVTEVSASDKLEELRSEMEHFVQLSFPTIAGAGPNGAIVHYRPEAASCATIARNELFLLDSGAQYRDGTTDVTRTVCFDAPTDEQRDAYTRVLKGHIAINSAVFPDGTAGIRLDSLARLALWQVGLDFGHGVGHGVGHFLNVHEGPHGIGARPAPHDAALTRDVIVSNEPGYYKDGAYGIRIENLELVVPKKTKNSAEGFLGMQSLTMAPLCRDLIHPELLTPSEVSWVNNYHQTVRLNLSVVLEKRLHQLDELTLGYLAKHCASF
jgi:Xaa-Pro aminopeptidase